MILGVPKEILSGERRVAALPETVQRYVEMGFDVWVQSSAGEGALRSDGQYRSAGATIIDDPETLFRQADLVLKVKQPIFNEETGKHEVEMIRRGATLITFLHPAAPANHDMVRALRERHVTALTMDDIPRIARAGTMDALMSMSTVSGYKAVLIAADRFPRFIPNIDTTLGALPAAKFLVIGAGVVGMQAVATAKGLGGEVEVMDIREDARRRAEGLGARAVGFEVPTDLSTAQSGSAKALPPGWVEKAREALGPFVERADIVITSALVPGEMAPVLVTEEMVRRMKPGSVIVDVAIDQGGNCALTQPGAEVVRHGVLVCGVLNIPGSVPVDASWLYANNVLEYVKNLFKNGLDTADLDDEIVRHSLVTHQGKIVHQGTLKAMGEAGTAPA
ncbi:MAG: NAD(P) transhydrogenase subunit alpha [Planctomycetota bacterium]|jgi:NAD(P) transhydrogenase subunit alpha